MKDFIPYNIKSGKPLSIGYYKEHNARGVKFVGYEMESKENVLFLNLKVKKVTVSIPLVDYRLPITYDLTQFVGYFDASLEERTTDNSLIKKSKMFNVVVEPNLEALLSRTLRQTNLWYCSSMLHQTINHLHKAQLSTF